jgi:tetratricopeptide (TPR) repeat protein
MSVANEESIRVDGSRYDSFTGLKEVHATLLKRYSEGETEELLDEISTFIQRASNTGAVLDAENERDASQSLIDYWMTIIYRAKRTPPDATLAEFNPDLAPRLDDDKCPYLGLNAFQESDKEKFFGRQRGIELLLKKIKTNRILFVDGPSGSGKSSLVLAGLIPALKQDILPGSGGWRYFPAIVPGANPLKNLAKALAESQHRPADWIAEQAEAMEHNPKQLLAIVSSFGPEPAVLVVDQFEEAFTLCLNDAWRGAFIDNLLSLAQPSDTRHQVILTLRSDYNSYLAQYPPLMKRFEAAQVQVMPLTASDLRAAIEEPAKRIDLRFQEGVVDALVRDILGEPEGLPLLQFTLLRLWKTREDKRNRITLAQYRKLGGARRALALTADDFYHSLTNAKRITLERIMLRLALPSGNAEVLRNSVRRETLYFEDPSRVDEVIDALADAGLVRITKGDTRADDKIEIAHEALVRHWPMLVEWIEKRRASMRQRLRLTVAAEQWFAHGKDEGGLLGGSLLTEALQQEDLNDLEKEFVRASQVLAERLEQEKEAAREREAKLNQDKMTALQQRADEVAKSAKRMRQFAAILAVATLFFFAAAAFGSWQAVRARASEKLAKANEVRAEKSSELARDEKNRANAERDKATASEAVAKQKEADRAKAANEAIVAQKRAEVESAHAKQQTALALKEKKEKDDYLAQLTVLNAEKDAKLALKNETETADAEQKKKHFEGAIAAYKNLAPKYTAAKDLRGASNTLSKLSMTHRMLAQKLRRKGDAASVASAKENSAAADVAYQDALKLLDDQRTAAGNDKAKLTAALWDLAQFYLENEKIDDVDKTYRTLLAMHESDLNKTDSAKQKNYDDAVETMVEFYRDKRPVELEKLYLRVLEKKKLVYDINDPEEIYQTLTEMAQFYRDDKKYEKVIPVYIEMLDLLKRYAQTRPGWEKDEEFIEYLIDDSTDLAAAYEALPHPDYPNAEKYYSDALTLEKNRHPLSEEEAKEANDIRRRFAEVLRRQGRLNDALKSYDEVIAFYSKDPSNNVGLALSLAATGQIHAELKDPELALKAFKDAAAKADGNTPLKDKLGEILVSQVRADFAKASKGNAEEAMKYFTQAEGFTNLAASISPKTVTSTSQSLISSLGEVRQTLFKSGDVTVVENLYEKILALKLKDPTRGDYGTEYLIQELEKMYRDEHDDRKLIALYERILEMSTRSGPESDNPAVFGYYNSLGQLYLNSGKYGEAAKNYQKALEIVERVFHKDDASYVVESLARLAHAYRLAMNYAEAEKLYLRAKANLQVHGRGDSSKMAEILDSYAEILELTNRKPEAARVKLESQKIRNTAMGPKAKS